MGFEQEYIKGLRRLSDDTPDGRIEVGPTEPYLGPLDKINMVSQVRQEINADELQELTDSLIYTDENGQPYIGLIQPITVGFFTGQELSGYLARLNQTWGSNHKVEDLTPLNEDPDHYLVVIAGHRRTLGIRAAAEKIGINAKDVDVTFHLRRGDRLTFREAITTQYRENFHKRPESWEDARAISAILREGMEAGDYQTFADCARDLAIDPDRVSRAYRFQTLPLAVQEMVEMGTLNFGRAILLADLYTIVGYTEIESGLSDELKHNLRQKIQQNKLYLEQVTEHMDRAQKALFDEACLSHAVKLVSLPSHGKAKVYCDELIHSLFNSDQLTLIAYEESEIIRAQERKNRQAERDIAVTALQSLAAVLVADRERMMVDGQPVLTRSPRVATQLKALQRAVDRLAYHKKGETLSEEPTVSAGIEAARQLLAGLLVEPEDQTDILTEASSRMF